MATKWMQTESLKDQAEAIIKDHNSKYNPGSDEDMLFEDKKPALF